MDRVAPDKIQRLVSSTTFLISDQIRKRGIIFMQENIEIWKDVVGYEGIYQVSNFGNVKSLDKIVFNNGSRRYNNIKGRVLSQNKTNGNGYRIVSLNNNGCSKNYYIHRLVASSFLENKNNFKYINHKDENKLNNNIDNLEWCDAKYNANYGTSRERARQKLLNNKSTSKQVSSHDRNTMELIKTFPSISEASRQLNCAVQNISDALHGKQPTARGYIWKYL